MQRVGAKFGKKIPNYSNFDGVTGRNPLVREQFPTIPKFAVAAGSFSKDGRRAALRCPLHRGLLSGLSELSLHMRQRPHSRNSYLKNGRFLKSLAAANNVCDG
tara:strand:+ start:2403 stop:2711 length:309 start_codon:yes stop_codon:yes gene_type:complete